VKKNKHFRLVVVKLSSSSHLNSHVPVLVVPVNTVLSDITWYAPRTDLFCQRQPCLLLPPSGTSLLSLNKDSFKLSLERVSGFSIHFLHSRISILFHSSLCFYCGTPAPHHRHSKATRPPNVSRQIRHRSFAAVNSFRDNFLTGNLAACEA
jgi:hypothetical protein